MFDPAALGTLRIGLDAERSEQSAAPRRGARSRQATKRRSFRVAVAAELRDARRPPGAADHPGSARLTRVLALRRRQPLPGGTGA